LRTDRVASSFRRFGAALVIGAGVLWFTGSPSVEQGRHVQVMPRVGPGEAGIVVAGRL